MIIRADASSEIGTGHIMRMLALAQAWQDTGMANNRFVRFVCADVPPGLEARLADESFSVSRIKAKPGGTDDLEQLLAIAGRHLTGDDRWIVLDGYHFDAHYQSALRKAGFHLLVVDDYGHLDRYDFDVLLNQNAGAEVYGYPSSAWSDVLLGPRYALLRREFRTQEREDDAIESALANVPETARRILVTMGGADASNISQQTLESILALSNQPCEVRLVAGAANPHLATLREVAAGNPGHVEIYENIRDMPALMRWADMAVTAAGSTCWELLAMRVPLLVVILADNQERIAGILAARGVAVNLGWWNEWSNARFQSAFSSLASCRESRINMIKQGQEMVDGQGAIKVCRTLEAHGIQLRPAVAGDAGMLWTWANDPGTRNVSFNREPIPWEQHVAWFDQKLKDAGSRIYIGEINCPVAVVRFDDHHNEDHAVISLAVAPGARGRGYSARIIRLGVRALFAESRANLVRAYIKPDNIPSIRAFERAGFKLDGSTHISGQPALIYIARRDAHLAAS
jgi:UDP-2,4-diacetamido-2,4,6-trideoxy-beta-L-altropyranose hydrolase